MISSIPKAPELITFSITLCPIPLNLAEPNLSKDPAIRSATIFASRKISLISLISIWGLSNLKTVFKALVSSLILDPLEPTIKLGLPVEIIIFSPKGIFLRVICEILAPFSLFSIYFLI